MNFADVIKKCSMDAFDASLPCDVQFGTVVSTEPCRVAAGGMILPDDVLVIAKHLLYKETKIEFTSYDKTVVINEGLCEGDTLVLLRKRGGECYVAVAKI